MSEQTTCAKCGEDMSEREILLEINRKMDVADAKIDALKLHAAKHGAVAGAISGGIVVTAIEYIKIKFLGMHG